MKRRMPSFSRRRPRGEPEIELAEKSHTTPKSAMDMAIITEELKMDSYTN